MTKKWLSLWLVMLMLLPCAALAGEIQAMGRYVESEIPMPEEFVHAHKLFLSEDGRLMILGWTMDESKDVPMVVMKTYTEGDQGWTEAPRARNSSGFYDAAQYGDAIYVLYYHHEENEERVSVRAGQLVDGEVVALDFDFGDAFPSKLEIAADGALLIQASQDCVFAFDPATGEMRERFDGLDGAFTTQDGGLFAISRAGQSVMQFDVTTGELIHEMENAPITGWDDVLAFDGEALYLANKGGIYRATPGGSIWEQLVDGSLTSLCLPSTSPGGMVVRNGEIYVLIHSEQGARLMRYAYDANVSARPAYELNVCTLYESATLTQAASIFQKHNPDYIVNITALLSAGTGVTADDAVRALNTELLAGMGPDVLLLDGMPMDDYIDKGVLYDLGQMVGELTGAGELVSPLFNPFYRDGKIYAVPTSCELPVALGKAENLNMAETLDDLTALIRQSEAETPVVWRTRQGYFNMFLETSFPAWFGVDGQLNEDVFTQYLNAVDAIYERTGVEVDENSDDMSADKQNYLRYLSHVNAADIVLNGIQDFSIDLLRLRDDRLLLHPMGLGSFNSLMIELTLVDDMGGTLAWLPGQSKHVYTPIGMLGVNARSPQIEAAVALVRAALSQDVQDVDAYVGLPVNRKSLNALIEKDSSDTSVGVGWTDPFTGEEMRMDGNWPVRALREKIGELLDEAQTPYIPDDTLIQMIKTELAPWFGGEMDAGAATAQVSAKVRAYLAE